MAAELPQRRQRSASLPSRPNPGPEHLAPLLSVARQVTQGMHDDPHFFVKGSMAAALHGGRVTPGDLDMMVGSYPKVNRVVQPMGYPRFSAMRQRGNAVGKPSLDVLHAQDWGAVGTPTEMKSGVRVTSLARTLRDLRTDPRPEKRGRNARLVADIIHANTREAPF